MNAPKEHTKICCYFCKFSKKFSSFSLRRIIYDCSPVKPLFFIGHFTPNACHCRRGDICRVAANDRRAVTFPQYSLVVGTNRRGA